ncbi:MAG: hypothetical protein IT393_10525 [Nitrospirae bacterium]|nr:hypothetical protein [Nitrospirota bacterium]
MEKRENDFRNVSHHILPTSSNLLGLCFILLGFIKTLQLRATTLIDDMLVFPILMFMAASICSYISIRSVRKAEKYERIADYLFLSGLGFLTVIAVVVALEFVV